MPRILGAARNELRINDNLSGSVLRMYYRMPTTEERVGWQNLKVQRQGGKVKIRLEAAIALYGPKILVGVGEGDFVAPDGRAISSEPGSKDYSLNWKKQVVEHAFDVVELMALRVFEGSVSLAEAAEADEDDGPAPEPEGEADDILDHEDAAGNLHET